jgi:radical SAM superfamily enzyme YgiQ (UPF0313 family)
MLTSEEMVAFWKNWIEQYQGIDVVVSGEGEVATTLLMKHLEDQQCIESLDGITFRNNQGNIQKNPQGQPMSMADVPFVYRDELEDLDHRILYYETSRGCPYHCQYCLSSIEKGVRFRPLDLVLPELQFFLDQKVRQVKFVDRTFNADKKHAMAIWSYLKDHDNGYTNFHFEITADLLDELAIEFLNTVRTGLFQFEIGVQSTNEATIVDIERKMDFSILKERVLSLKKGHNIHLHLDLIAGLPKETYKAFNKSFDDVMAIRPEQLQLGFLKVLKGSMIYDLQKEYGITYRSFAPYEVLMTKELSYLDLRQLKQIEDLLERYYNSGQFPNSVSYMMSQHESPFVFFEKFAKYWEEKGLFHLKHHKLKLYDFLLAYAKTVEGKELSTIQGLLTHDLCLQEKPKKWPDYVNPSDQAILEIKEIYQDEVHQSIFLESYSDYTTKQISRMAHMEKYNFDIVRFIESGFTDMIPKASFVFYNYVQKDLMTSLATVTVIY